MRMVKRVLAIFVLLILLAVSFGNLYNYAQQVVENSQTVAVQAKEEPEKTVGSPQNIKEKIAIFVFVGWMWMSVVVLVLFLRLKIKEADRLHRFKFFSDEKE